MNFFLAIMVGFVFMCFTDSKTQQDNYLPVNIVIRDTTLSLPEVMLNLKVCFGARKIKTITKNDIMDYIKSETFSLGQEYRNRGGDINDFNKVHKYILENMRKVANGLTIDIRVDKDNFINDTIRWSNLSLPPDFSQKLPKPVWHYMVLDSTNSTNMLQMSQSIVDSIIASNVLVKE